MTQVTASEMGPESRDSITALLVPLVGWDAMRANVEETEIYQVRMVVRYCELAASDTAGVPCIWLEIPATFFLRVFSHSCFRFFRDNPLMFGLL
jgi:hypothetical protein